VKKKLFIALMMVVLIFTFAVGCSKGVHLQLVVVKVMLQLKLNQKLKMSQVMQVKV